MVRIAIIDDDPSIVDVYSNMLTFFGYEPVAYTDPSEALTKIPLEEHLPSLILLDLMMTPLTGLQFLEKRRTIGRLKDIPVFIVSAWDVPDEDRRKYAGDFCEIVRKPVFPRDLAEMIRKTLEQ
ncbi:response regulator [Methanoregula sp. PtaB.Bin085]|uniref:response regulator n=1 Tax=Methanoregula sp. PtaB.Bin085 TaxID=1811680 RepID=UPI0009C76D29|nr:response regulator [Methanoregula sp. PtaB.Bin085]OPX64440.1 MAG: transcriptional regulator PhoB [Methanoregula sp. PtaB.Bin085]